MSTDVPERFELTSQAPTDDRVGALRGMFPEVFSDGRIDFEALRRALGELVESGPERFGLAWPGKADCARVIQETSVGTLVPCPDESVDWDSTQNVIIEGENLEALKLLQKAYYGRVKLIYIDPPYNTGNEFIYPDNFKEGLADYLRYSGQVDAEGFRLSANAETDGRYHSKWLSMMYPRLFLARNLLQEDGVIFVSIDDHELHNLRALMNEIFGEESFIACCVWQKRYSRENRGAIGDAHEYLLVYGREKELFQDTRGLIAPTEKQTAIYKNRNNDPNGRWRPIPLDVQAGHATPAQFYSVTTPAGVVHEPSPGRAWSVTKERLDELISEGRVYFGKDGTAKPNLIRYLTEMEGLVPWTWWPSDEVGHTDEARKEVQEIFGTQNAFDTPKPTRLMKRILEIGCGPNDLVLDFFSGSGTMGQAVMEQNASDGGNRQFMLVQLPEPTTSDPSGTPGEGQSIADVTRGRIRWAGTRVAQAPSRLGVGQVDVGFRAYRLSASNFQVWDGTMQSADGIDGQLAMSVDHVTDAATEQAMLAELLLKAGFPLTASIEAVDLAGVSGYAVAGGALLICLSQGLTIEAFEAMVESEPAMILVLDAGFNGNDELKVNALQTVRARNQSSGSDIALRVV